MTRRLYILLTLIVGAACLRPAYGQTVEEVQQHYAEGRLHQTITLGTQALRQAPEDPGLNLLVGRALVDTEAYADALPYLEQTVGCSDAAAWMKAWALNYLGKAQFALGHAERARAALTEAIQLQATPSATRSAEGWLRTLGFTATYDGWQTRESAHFIFRFSPLLQARDLERYVDEHEQAFGRIAAFFDAPLPKKIHFFVWESNREAAQAGMPPLGFARPEVSLLHARYDQTVGHEMTHVISHHGVRPVAKTPFVNEGTAVCFDQSGADRMRRAQEALAQHGAPGVSVLAVWEDWEAYPSELTYPLAGAFVDYLIRQGGKQPFLNLFSNQTLDHAWDVYGDRLITLMTEFEVELGSQGVPH